MKWISSWLVVLLLVLSLAVSTKSGSEGTGASSASRPVQSSSKPQAVSSVEEPEPVNIALPVDIAPGWEDLRAANANHEKGQQGYIDGSGKLVLEGKYWIAEDFREGLALVLEGESGIGSTSDDYYINARGEKQFGTGFLNATSISEGKAVVQGQDHICRVIDINSNTVVELAENVIWTYSRYREGMLLAEFEVGDERLYGYYDAEGNIAIEPKYSDAFYFSEGLAAVIDKMTSNLMYINPAGYVVIDTGMPITLESVYIYQWSFSEGLACTSSGYIDQTGKIIIDFAEYEQQGKGKVIRGDIFREGLALIVTDEKYFFVDKTGRIVLEAPEGYWYYQGFNEGLAAVAEKKTNKIGFMNKQGKMVLKCQYVYFDDENGGMGPMIPDYIFCNGTTRAVRYGDEGTWVWGTINTKGEWIYISE